MEISGVDYHKVEENDEISLKLSDLFIILGWFIGIAYFSYLIVFKHQDFSLFGAVFMVTMGAVFVKAFYETFILSFGFISRKLKTKSNGFKFKTPELFKRRIEISIRVVYKDNSKIKF